MMIMSLLSSSPKNGVELMDGIEAMTRGWWRPSPGSIYPLLKSLKQEGLVKPRDDGRYELTGKARVEIEVAFGPSMRAPKNLEGMTDEVESFVTYVEELAASNRPELGPSADRIRSLAQRLQSAVEGPSS